MHELWHGTCYTGLFRWSTCIKLLQNPYFSSSFRFLSFGGRGSQASSINTSPSAENRCFEAFAWSKRYVWGKGWSDDGLKWTCDLLDLSFASLTLSFGSCLAAEIEWNEPFQLLKENWNDDVSRMFPKKHLNGWLWNNPPVPAPKYIS